MSSRRFPWLPVAVWEFYRTVSRKDFLVSILLAPVLAVGLGFFMAWIEKAESDRVRRVAVAWTGAEERSESLPPLEGFEWVAVSGEEATRAALERSVEGREVEAALLLSPRYAFDGQGELILRRLDPSWKRRLEGHLTAEARRQRAEVRGITASELERFDAPIELAETSPLPDAGARGQEKLVAEILAFLLMMSIFVTGAYMGIGITGEKQARVTEVIVSAIPPQAWIDGKMAAYATIGFLQASLWGLAGLGFVLFSPWNLSADLGGSIAAVAVAYSLLGLAFYAALFAFIYATIKDLQSTSKFQAYLYFLPLLPLFIAEPALENPEAAYIVVLSLLPPFSPILMPMRAAIGGASIWEILGGLLLLSLALYFMLRAAGQAFRIGMLMYGKDVSLPELVRWARES